MSKKKAEQQAGAPKKKGKKKWIVIGVVVFLILAAAIGGGNNKTDEEKETSSTGSVAESTEAPEVSTEAAEPETEASAYTLEHGELLEANTNEIDGQNVLVVKAKIASSYDNGATINQNYYNVEDLIQSQGCDEFDEIQYWAVADMSDGSEQKVVSFTVDADLIQQIADKKVVANQLGDYVTDLWILPSLAE
jgi:flagellar basal body-associated protein FliL